MSDKNKPKPAVENYLNLQKVHPLVAKSIYRIPIEQLELLCTLFEAQFKQELLIIRNVELYDEPQRRMINGLKGFGLVRVDCGEATVTGFGEAVSKLISSSIKEKSNPASATPPYPSLRDSALAGITLFTALNIFECYSDNIVSYYESGGIRNVMSMEARNMSSSHVSGFLLELNRAMIINRISDWEAANNAKGKVQ